MHACRNLMVAGLVALLAGGAWVMAQEKKADPAAGAAGASGTVPPGNGMPAGMPSSPEAMAKMVAWMQLAQTGPQHEKLKTMAGKFKADVWMQMDPNSPEEKSFGESDNSMLFGGKYLKGDYNGTFMSMPFAGMGLYGFDNAKQKYVSVWIDSMSTMMMTSEGTEEGKSIVFKTECLDPVTKKTIPGRQVLTIEDSDHHTFEAYQTLDGKEHKCMVIKYTRAAG